MENESYCEDTLNAVLRGLRSEDDSAQLRAIILSVEALRGLPKRTGLKWCSDHGTNWNDRCDTCLEAKGGESRS